MLHRRLSKDSPAGSKVIILQGTLEYLAPEVLVGWIAKSKGADPEAVCPCTADMWSAGCLLLETYTSQSPFRVRWHAWMNLTMDWIFGLRMGRPQSVGSRRDQDRP